MSESKLVFRVEVKFEFPSIRNNRMIDACNKIIYKSFRYLLEIIYSSLQSNLTFSTYDHYKMSYLEHSLLSGFDKKTLTNINAKSIFGNAICF